MEMHEAESRNMHEDFKVISQTHINSSKHKGNHLTLHLLQVDWHRKTRENSHLELNLVQNYSILGVKLTP